MAHVSTILTASQFRTLVRTAMDDMDDAEYLDLLNAVIYGGKNRKLDSECERIVKHVTRTLGPEKIKRKSRQTSGTCDDTSWG